MEAALESLRGDVATCIALEQQLRGKPASDQKKGRSNGKSRSVAAQPRAVEEALKECLFACTESRKRAREEALPKDEISDDALSQMHRFTKYTALKPYQNFLHYVPRLVNVVTVSHVAST